MMVTLEPLVSEGVFFLLLYFSSNVSAAKCAELTTLAPLSPVVQYPMLSFFRQAEIVTEFELRLGVAVSG